MKVRLLVVRHGETDFNIEHRINGQFDSDLTITGIRESERCGQYLQSLKFDKVLVSDLGRTVKTLRCLGLAGQLEPRLRDRNFGPYNGQLYASYVKAKHEERQRLCNKVQDIDGQYLVPSSTSSCVLSCASHVSSCHINGHANRYAIGNGKADVCMDGLPGEYLSELGDDFLMDYTNGFLNGDTNGHTNTDGLWKERLSADRKQNAYYQEMLTEIEPAGVERYEELFRRIQELIHHTVHVTTAEQSRKQQHVTTAEQSRKQQHVTANVLFVTHCSPVRMCAMVLSSLSSDKFPTGLRKFNIPNNSISEYIIHTSDVTDDVTNDVTHRIDKVELVKLASTKHLHM